MGRDEVLLHNDSEVPLILGPGEKVPACLLFDPSSTGENVVHFSYRRPQQVQARHDVEPGPTFDISRFLKCPNCRRSGTVKLTLFTDGDICIRCLACDATAHGSRLHESSRVFRSVGSGDTRTDKQSNADS